MTRLQYLINNDDVLDLIAGSHGVDKNTDEIKQCHLLKCCDCKFNGDNCYSDMRDYLLEPVTYSTGCKIGMTTCEGMTCTMCPQMKE